MKAKRIIAALMAVLLILSLVACGGSENNNGVDTPSVYWLNFKPELDGVLQDLAAKYTKAKKIEVKVVTPESGTYSATLAKELNSDDPPTLFVLSNQHEVNEWNDYLTDLKDTSIAGQLRTDAYNLYGSDGKLAAIGYCYECYGIVVNKELVELLDFKLADINNFESLKQAVEYIHNNASWLGFDAFASVDLGDENSWKYTAHLANLEYFYESRDKGGWDSCPESLTGAYMSNYKSLYDLIINNSISKPEESASSERDPDTEFKNKEAAFTLEGSWNYASISESVPSAVMIPYYSGMEGEEMAGLNCGTENYWAVNDKVSKEDIKATTDFMTWLVTDEEASAALSEKLGALPFKEAVKSENGFLNNAASYTEKKCYVMDWAFNYQPNKEQYRADLVTALKAYNSDQSDEKWKAVESAFVDGWAKQYEASKE